ncbi:uncharacterized protein LOC110837628 [Zootermopsis nevadensis]|uniref:Uncharacterized protein n=1 Tax=Zootermopsis nevadensis TaxID=136037 RepID=A0A067QXH5_ZOONE|nr:uncharacterized protein LOC110837628 [Zootermopsis nevadensis]KDR10842.1 hypothetical protein L798_14824 [Zootermopsis nevadensis]
MGILHKSIVYTAISLAIISLLIDEVDARRKILQGRKTITRTYYKANAVPAWGIVVIVACSMIIVGGILYAVMKKIILGSSSSSSGGATTYHNDDEV